MARKNPDKAKEAFKRLSAEIIRHGDDGEGDLKDLFEVHRPDVIFKLDQGPERQARAAQLLGEMTNLSRELTEAKYHREREGKKKKVSRTSKAKPRREVSGTHDGFRYVLVQLPDGQWGAKITRRGRQIIPSPGAPPIFDSPALNKRFPDQGAAEVAVRRVINTALIWYDERGIRPREKVRRSKKVRGGIHRRTAGQREAMERETTAESEAAAEERRRERVREGRRKAKVGKSERMRRPSEPGKPARGRKLVYIPKGNPSNPFSFRRSESAAIKQAKKALEKSEEWQARWNESLKAGKPDFAAVMKAYDHIENARANFVLGEEKGRADKAMDRKSSLRRNIIEMFKTCTRELSKRKSNPSQGDHREMGNSHMEKADACWKKYCDSCNVTDLLNAYKHLEIAREELQHAGDTDGVAQARARIKLARQELRKRNKS